VRITRGVAALLLATVLIGAVTGCSSTDAVARVNGEEITRAEFDAIYEQIVAQSGGQLDDETALAYKKQLLEMMIDSALITQEAERLGADLSEEAVTERLSQLMGGADEATIEEQITAAGLTVEDVRKSVRDQLANEFLQAKVSSETSVTTVPQTYSQLSHILVSDEAFANDLYERAIAGEEFAALASENSSDTASAIDGGNLGWAPTSDYVAEFAAAADALDVGEISKPVQSQFGWHIILKVAEAAKGTAISEAPADLQAVLAASGPEIALREYVAKLRADAEIEYLDESLAPSE
jgi:parvulin-like peptidyl-prolyl isomerase